MEKNKIKRTEVNTLGEFGLIHHLTKDFPSVQESTLLGVGDDAAVINCGDHCMVVTTDMMMEGIHFDLMYNPLKHLGYKAVITNLSDVYAMNAMPTQITVSIAISSKVSVEALEELYAGVEAACKEYKVDLIGGDTTSSTRGIAISITALGMAKEDNIVYRSGAKVGDLICVTGDLGGAFMGLQLLEREKRLYLEDPNIKPDLEGRDYIVGRQLKPEARADIIQFFARENLLPTSMIDVSDGISSDIRHICTRSGVGCIIEENELPIFDETKEMAFKFQMDPSMAALNGGEDYELLFTIDPSQMEAITKVDEGITIIGEITGEKHGYKLKSKGGNLHNMEAQGWQHFDQ